MRNREVLMALQTPKQKKESLVISIFNENSVEFEITIKKSVIKSDVLKNEHLINVLKEAISFLNSVKK